MELGNWPIKVQLGSTNSKGLPVLFQGSHQGLLLNNQLIHYMTGAVGMPMVPSYSSTPTEFEAAIHPSSSSFRSHH